MRARTSWCQFWVGRDTGHGAAKLASTTHSYGWHQPGANHSKRPYNHSTRSLLQKILPLRGAELQRLAAHDILHGGRRAEKGCRSERKVQKHAARRGGSGTGGAIAQFSTGRRCDYWQCTGRLWSSGFAAAPHSKPAGVALATPLVGDRVRLAPRPHRSSPPGLRGIGVGINDWKIT